MSNQAESSTKVESNKRKGRGPKQWLAALAVFCSGALVVNVVLPISTSLAMAATGLASVLGCLAVLGFLRWANIGRVVGFMSLLTAVGIGANVSDAQFTMQEEELARLHLSNETAYLEKLKDWRGDEAWLEALKEIQPSAYEQELRERTAREAEKRQRERLAEIAKKREQNCTTSYAWMYATEAVKTRLKSPRSAKFPWSFTDHIKTVGDCKFVIRSFVDAQNGFGAEIRTPWTATLQYTDEGSWTFIELALL